MFLHRYILALLLVLIPSTIFAATKRATILFFNDFHGHFEADSQGGSAAQIASVVNGIRKENQTAGIPTFLFFEGDAIAGSLISREFKGMAEFEFFNSLGVDAMAIGNHDMDDGIAALEAMIKTAKFPVLSANIYRKESGERLTVPYEFISKDGVIIGAIGLITKDADIVTHPKIVENFKFSDPAEESLRESVNLKANSDLVVALTHIGSNEGIMFAKEIKNFDVILGGHDHTALKGKPCELIGRVPFCMTPSHGKYLGRLDIQINRGKVKCLGSKLIPITNEIKEDPIVAELVRGYSQKIDKRYSTVIGKASEKLDRCSNSRCALGSLVAESIRKKTRADVGLMNSGGLRSPINEGPITLKTIVELSPFANSLIRLKATGSELMEILKFGVSSKRGYPQWSGLDFDITDGQVVDVKIGGKPIDLKKVYLLGTHDFLSAGGDGYSMLKKLPMSKNYDGVLIYDAVVDYIKHKKTIPADLPLKKPLLLADLPKDEEHKNMEGPGLPPLPRQSSHGLPTLTPGLPPAETPLPPRESIQSEPGLAPLNLPPAKRLPKKKIIPRFKQLPSQRPFPPNPPAEPIQP